MPTVNKVEAYIHNACVQYLRGLRETFELAIGKVAATSDLWSADKLVKKQSFMGVTVCWTHIDGTGRWSIREKVIGFRAVSGDHGGENLGRYFIAICQRVGIVNKKKKVSKVCDGIISH